MSRIEKAFASGKAFIPFITAGDPNLEITEELVYEMAAAGADLIELGIPFSDPVAEGPIIQAADDRALSAGFTTDQLFDLVKKIRLTCDVPLVFMTYANPVFRYGTEKFLGRCKEVGIDGLIVPDIPYEERMEIKPFCEAYGITLISMITPTSKERIRRIVAEAEGFVYCVSSLGVTGIRSEFAANLKEMIDTVKEVKEIPCALGFGISSKEQVAELSGLCDGIIVGSAIVKMIGEYGTGSIQKVATYVKEMKAAM